MLLLGGLVTNNPVGGIIKPGVGWQTPHFLNHFHGDMCMCVHPRP